MTSTKMKNLGATGVAVSVVLSIVAGVAIGIFTAMSYMNSQIASAVSPLAKQVSALNASVIRDTSLNIIIAEKANIPSSEVADILDTPTPTGH